MTPMLRRLLALASALAVTSAGITPCAAAAIARGPLGADPHAAHHASAAAPEHAAHDAGCREARAALVPHCNCGCTSDRPHAVADSTPRSGSLPEEVHPVPAGPVRAEPPAPPLARADAPRPHIEHVPIAS